jgi:hypothetical protein
MAMAMAMAMAKSLGLLAQTAAANINHRIANEGRYGKQHKPHAGADEGKRY